MQKEIVTAWILACGLILTACTETEEEKQASAKAALTSKAEKIVKAGNFEEAIDAAIEADDDALFEALMDAQHAREKALSGDYIDKMYPKLTDEICNLNHAMGLNDNPDLLKNKLHQLSQNGALSENLDIKTLKRKLYEKCATSYQKQAPSKALCEGTKDAIEYNYIQSEETRTLLQEKCKDFDLADKPIPWTFTIETDNQE